MKHLSWIFFALIVVGFLSQAFPSKVFAITPSDITVKANGITLSTVGNPSALPTTTASIDITSDLDATFTCQLNLQTGGVVQGAQLCNTGNTPGRNGHIDYPGLNSNVVYVFLLTALGTDGTSAKSSFQFTVGASASSESGAFAGESAQTPQSNQETAETSLIANGAPPWTACSSSNTGQAALPGNLVEINYETTGKAKLRDVLTSNTQDLDLSVTANFVNGRITGKLSNGENTDFKIHSTDTECQYMAPKSAFSAQTSSPAGVKLDSDNSKASNPPFKPCSTNDISAKYEINTTINDANVHSLIGSLDNNQDVKVVIHQFFKKSTGQPDEVFYSGELIVDKGSRNEEKINLVLDGNDIFTTCSTTVIT